MRSRIHALTITIALAATGAALLSPRLAAADEPAPARPAVGPVAAAPALSPLRAAVEAAAVERMPVSAPLVVAGGVVAGLGAAGALTGLLLMSAANNCNGSTCTQRDAGRVALSVGAPLLAAGLIMVVVGIQPAPEPAKPGDARARLVPAVAIGPTGGAVRWSF